MAAQIRRNLYAEVTSRILAELERGAAPWVKPWSATPGQNVPQNAITNRPIPAATLSCYGSRTTEAGQRRNSSRSNKCKRLAEACAKASTAPRVYFVKQLRITEGEGEAAPEQLVLLKRVGQ